MWDAQLHYPQNAFDDMWDWLVTTIRHFQARPELQLIIRVHPAELRGHIQSRQPIAEEVLAALRAVPGMIEARVVETGRKGRAGDRVMLRIRREGRPDETREIFESVSLSDDFPEFLTIPAYKYLD